jgi:hypothetical protein
MISFNQLTEAGKRIFIAHLRKRRRVDKNIMLEIRAELELSQDDKINNKKEVRE